MADTQLKNTGELDTRYTRAQQEWDDRIGSARVQAYNWRRIAFINALGMLACIGGIVHLGQQPKSVVRVVALDRLGELVAQADSASAVPYHPGRPQIKHHLQRFVDDVRSLPTDAVVIEERWKRAFYFVDGTARAMLNDFYESEARPFERSATEAVRIEQLASVPISASSWQLDWRETRMDAKGEQIGVPQTWRGMFTVEVRPIDKVPNPDINPIGLYIVEYHWDRIND